MNRVLSKLKAIIGAFRFDRSRDVLPEKIRFAIDESLARVSSIHRQQNEQIFEKLSAAVSEIDAALNARFESMLDRFATNGGQLRANGGALQGISNDQQRLIEAADFLKTASPQTREALEKRIDDLLATVENVRRRISDDQQKIIGSVEFLKAAWPQAHESLETRINALSHIVSDIRQILIEEFGDTRRERSSDAIASVLADAMHDLSGALAETRPALKRAAGDLRKAAEIRTLVVNKSDELQNAMTHLAGQIETVRTETANRIYEIGNATKHVGGMVENSEVRLTNLIGDRLRDEMAEGIGRLLAIESELPKPYKRKAATCPISTPGVTFGEALRRAQADFPRQFSDWLERLAAAETAIEESVVGNLAYAADPYSRAFRNFVDRHAAGTVLDIGCGTHGRPVYLSGIPADQLFGLEPLLLRAPFDFPVVRGIAEYMPWENHSFDTAVSATAIDHALSLDRTLDEIVRVLVPNGTLLMWVGSNAGARPFKPDSPDYEPADRFHLFHIDRLWFEPVLETRFMIEDRVVMWTPSHEHVFYKLSVRSGRGRECLTSRV